MPSELVINATSGETRVALLEHGTLAEIYVERANDRSLVGNIYKGRVMKVLPGMQACFVNIGLQKAAFLYVSDVQDFSWEYGAFMGLDEEIDYSRARNILEDACRDKQSVACRFAALVYLNGWQVENDSARAADFFKQGCSLGDMPSCAVVGELYYYGDGLALDKELGKTLLKEACINGDKPSCQKYKIL